MFRRLSVFVGGCSLNDAAMLLDAAPDDTGDTLEECAALVDHSLVRREDAADGSPRLTMLGRSVSLDSSGCAKPGGDECETCARRGVPRIRRTGRTGID